MHRLETLTIEIRGVFFLNTSSERLISAPINDLLSGNSSFAKAFFSPLGLRMFWVGFDIAQACWRWNLFAFAI